MNFLKADGLTKEKLEEKIEEFKSDMIQDFGGDIKNHDLEMLNHRVNYIETQLSEIIKYFCSNPGKMEKTRKLFFATNLLLAIAATIIAVDAVCNIFKIWT